MFASHFARAQKKKGKTEANDAKTVDGTSSIETNDRRRGNTGPKRPNSSPQQQPSKKPHKRRRRRRRQELPSRRPRPTPQALELSAQLQNLTRQKLVQEALTLFWDPAHDAIRDNHHVCIVVDCCSKCKNVVQEAEKVVHSVKAAATIEVYTALLKCYGQAGHMWKARQLFRKLCRVTNDDDDETVYPRPNVRTLNTMLRGCLWTPTMTHVVNGQTHTAGGVVSSEEAWAWYLNLYKTEDDNDDHAVVDTSSYEATISLLCQALRIGEAEQRIAQLQKQYEIKCKGKASIKGGDQSSLETCGVAYLGLARAHALMGQADEMWTACQRCLHALQASKRKLQEQDHKEEGGSNGTTPRNPKPVDHGGKRSWKMDTTSEEGQKRVASNLVYRKHRLDEFENEARALLKQRTAVKDRSVQELANRLRTKLIYLTPHDNLPSGCVQSFGLEALQSNVAVMKEEEKLPLLSDGHIDMSKIFGSRNSSKKPVDIELGSGFGDWIVRQALAFSDRNHFAVELRADRVYQIFSRGCLTGDEPLGNLCAVGGDSGVFLRDRIHKGSVASVFANHPEPPTQILGQNLLDLEGIMAGTVTEPPHMLNSTTLGYAARVLIKGGRLVIVTDNCNYGNLLCATLVRLVCKKKGLLRGLEEAKAKKMKLKTVQTFPHDIVLYEGVPSLQLGHARDDMLAGQSYFDRLWKTGAGSHADTTRRYIVAVYRV